MSGFVHIDISYITAAVTYNEQNSPAAGCVSLRVAGVFDMMLDVASLAAVFKHTKHPDCYTIALSPLCHSTAYKVALYEYTLFNLTKTYI